jgi:superfamily I DNA/RNA helicase
LGERIQAARREVFGADGVDKLRRMLAYPFQLNFSVSASMTDAAEQLGALEPAQFHILDHISDVARAEIRGGAGTGKTVIAAEEAARLATAGNRTLLTCYSAPLAKELGRRLRNVPNLTVATFHAVCSQRAAAAGIQIDRNAKGQDLFDNVLPSALMDAMSMRPEDRWQAIVVDEGQDFLDTWWIALATALLPDGSIRVMSDTNQRVYGARRAPWPDLQLVPIRLISNLRNTKAIHRAAIAHYEGPEITPLGPDGSEANWIVSSDESALCSAAASELVRLVDKERVSPGDIAVLVPAANWIETFRQTAAHTGLEFSTCDDLTSEHVVVDTVRRFKGLERQATILVVSSADLSGTELAYVGMSRPRTYLTVIATDHDIQWLKPKPVSLGSKR